MSLCLFFLQKGKIMRKTILSVLLATAAVIAQAATPAQLLETYTAEAVKQTPGFQPSAQRGAQFYAQRFAVSEKMPSCTTCHTDNPAQTGRHAVTGKAIKPLAPRAEATRFTDPAKVEKWFKRNCGEVVGRECSAAEKADFIQFLSKGE
jgi:cytochrome c553